MNTETDCSLLTKARDMLRTTERSYLDIYTDTGLSPNWLSRLATKRMKDPSVNKVQRLYEYLQGKQLSI